MSERPYLILHIPGSGMDKPWCSNEKIEWNQNLSSSTWAGASIFNWTGATASMETMQFGDTEKVPPVLVKVQRHHLLVQGEPVGGPGGPPPQNCSWNHCLDKRTRRIKQQIWPSKVLQDFDKCSSKDEGWGLWSESNPLKMKTLYYCCPLPCQ